MNKEQKADFLKRLARGKATLSELTHVDQFDTTIPQLVWEETERGIYTNKSGEYFDKNNIAPGALVLTLAEFMAFSRKIGRYRTFIWGKSLLPGEVDPHEDEKKRWITFR